MKTEQLPGQKFTVRHNSPLLKYLYEIFPGQSRTGVKAYLYNGQIILNGRKVTAFDCPLTEGDTISILPKKLSICKEVKHSARTGLADFGVEIVYEDDHIIVVNKRSGLPVVETGKSAGHGVNIKKKGGHASLMAQKKETTVYSILCDYMRTAVHAERLSTREKQPWRPSHVFIVHRIDRDTSGLLVFAKDEKIRKILQDGWTSLVKERGYVGVVEGLPSPAEGTVVSWLKENPKSKKMMSSHFWPEDSGAGAAYGRNSSGEEIWQKAVTHYRTLIPGKYSLVEFHLETGRKNQIRIHAAEELGCPVSGDRKYGSSGSPAGRLALHAGTLAFVHPVSGKIMTFTARTPKEFTRLASGK